MADDDEILDEDDSEEEYNIGAIIGAAVLVLALIGGAVWYFLIREVAPEDELAQLPNWEAPEGLGDKYVTDLLPSMTINPRDSKGRYFLIVKIDVALSDQSVLIDLFGSHPWLIPQVQNIIIDEFSSYTMDELRTPKYKDMAKENIKAALNELAGWTGPDPLAEGEDAKPPVREVYFAKYILQ